MFWSHLTSMILRCHLTDLERNVPAIKITRFQVTATTKKRITGSSLPGNSTHLRDIFSSNYWNHRIIRISIYNFLVSVHCDHLSPLPKFSMVFEFPHFKRKITLSLLKVHVFPYTAFLFSVSFPFKHKPAIVSYSCDNCPACVQKRGEISIWTLLCKDEDPFRCNQSSIKEINWYCLQI